MDLFQIKSIGCESCGWYKTYLEAISFQIHKIYNEQILQ